MPPSRPVPTAIPESSEARKFRSPQLAQALERALEDGTPLNEDVEVLSCDQINTWGNQATAT